MPPERGLTTTRLLDADRPILTRAERLRIEAERWLEDPNSRHLKVTKLEGIGGGDAQYNATVAFFGSDSVGGWRHSLAGPLAKLYVAARAADNIYVSKITSRPGVPENDNARAAVIEAERLATDMLLKSALVRATIKIAKAAGFYRAHGISDEMVDSWLKASMMGGGKSVAVLDRPSDEIVGQEREALNRQHAEHLFVFNNELGQGKKHITAPDSGTHTSDMDMLKAEIDRLNPDAKYVASTSPELGGSGNPSPFTAHGVFHGTEAMLDYLKIEGKLVGKEEQTLTYAIQGGGGEVASTYIQLLREKYPNARIVLSESDVPQARARAAENAIRYGAELLAFEDNKQIFQQQDSIVILSGPPGQLTDESLALMKDASVKAVSGAANCYYQPYKEQEMSQKFADADILVANAPTINQKGLVNILWREFVPPEHRPDAETMVKASADVGLMIREMLRQVRESKQTDNPKTLEEVAREIALDEVADLLVQNGQISLN
jgi:glutamate dehydrogenase/leucine dehydrogenase